LQILRISYRSRSNRPNSASRLLSCVGSLRHDVAYLPLIYRFKIACFRSGHMAQSPKPGDYFPPENFPLSHPFFTHFRPLLNAAGFCSKASNIDALRQRRTQHFLRLQSCSFNSTLEREMTRFRTVIEAPFRKTPDGKRILQCHSRGDRRFSPFCCFLEAFGQTNSIENHYQRAKVFEGELHPKDWKQAKHFKKSGLKQTSWQIGPYRLPCVTNTDGNSFPLEDLGIQFYIALWHKYLLANSNLIAIATEFDDYEDPFKGKFPFCQADVIRQCVHKGIDSLRPMYAELHLLLKYGRVSPATSNR